MTLNQLCTSLPLSKRLKELGVNIKSVFYWANVIGTERYVIWHKEERSFVPVSEPIPAPTSSELMEILPDTIGKGEDSAMLVVRKEASDLYCVAYEDWNDEEIAATDDKSLADALALLLIHLIENGYYEPK